MTDFLYSARRRDPGSLRDTLASFVAPAAPTLAEAHGPFGSVAVAAARHERDALVEEEGRVSVLAGRPLLRGGGAAAAGAGRRAIHALLADAEPRAWDDTLDGPFAALGLRADGGGRVVTDLFAWIPVFEAEAVGGGLVVGTHPDGVAVEAGVAEDVDPVSVVEHILFQQVTWPATLYRGVRQVSPGADRALTAGGAWRDEGRVYWAPREERRFRDAGEAASELRAAIRADVRAACGDLDRVAVLASGGEDSRVVLGALPAGVSAEAFTLAPSGNREVRSAGRVARAYGARFTWALRPTGHDLAHFEAVSRLVGSQNHFTDQHMFPFHGELGLDLQPVVFGGFSSDTLVKAAYVTRSARRHGPGYRRPMEARALPGLRTELVEQALARRRAHLERIAALRPDSADEWFQFWPFTMRRYAAHFHGNRRLFAVHEPFHSNAVVRVAAATPQAWKVDRRLFVRAFRPELRPAWRVPHTRNRLPYFGATMNRLARGPLGLARRIRDVATGERGMNQESWPAWDEVASSGEMAAALERNPPTGSGAAAALAAGRGEAPWATPSGGWPPLSRLALLQLSFLLSDRGRARS